MAGAHSREAASTGFVVPNDERHRGAYLQEEYVNGRTSAREEEVRKETAELIVSGFNTAQKAMQQVAHLVVDSLDVMKTVERNIHAGQQHQQQLVQGRVDEFKGNTKDMFDGLYDKFEMLFERKTDILDQNEIDGLKRDIHKAQVDAEETHRAHVGERQQTQKIMAGLKAKMASMLQRAQVDAATRKGAHKEHVDDTQRMQSLMDAMKADIAAQHSHRRKLEDNVKMMQQKLKAKYELKIDLSQVPALKQQMANDKNHYEQQQQLIAEFKAKTQEIIRKLEAEASMLKQRVHTRHTLKMELSQLPALKEQMASEKEQYKLQQQLMTDLQTKFKRQQKQMDSQRNKYEQQKLLMCRKS